MRKCIALLVAITAGCGEGGGVETENQNPIAIGFIDPLELFVSQRETFALTEYFSDPDGDPLTYSAMSMDPENIEAVIEADTLAVLKGLGVTESTVTLTAEDIHGAKATINIEIVVHGPLRDDFITDEGWVGMVLINRQLNVYEIKDGHLVMNPGNPAELRYAWRDLGGTFGPNWKVEMRVRADAECYGFMAFSEEFIEGEIPRYVWSFDVDPYGYYIATILIGGEWQFLAEGYLPSPPRVVGDDEEYTQMAIGLTEGGVFYGYAYEDFKLFESDLNDIPPEFGINPDLTIEHIAFTAGTDNPLCQGYIWYDWIEVSIHDEGGDR